MLRTISFHSSVTRSSFHASSRPSSFSSSLVYRHQVSVLSSFPSLSSCSILARLSLHLFGDTCLWHAYELRPKSKPHLIPSRFLSLPTKLAANSFLWHRDPTAQDSPPHFQLQFFELREISFSPDFTAVLNDGAH